MSAPLLLLWAGGRGAVRSLEVGAVDASTLVVTFARAVSGDALAGVTLTGATTTGATIQADARVVYYALSAPVAYGDALTWAYAPGTLAWAAGGAVPAVGARAVTNNVVSPLAGKPIGLLLGLTYAE